MEKPFYFLLLIHLKKLGANKKHNITEFMKSHHKNDVEIVNVLHSMQDDGYIKYHAFYGDNPYIIPDDENAKIRVSAEIIKGGIEHLETIKNSNRNYIGLIILVIGGIIGVLTYLKGCTPTKIPDNQQSQKIVKSNNITKAHLIHKKDTVKK